MISELQILFGISKSFLRPKLPYCYLPKDQVFNLTSNSFQVKFWICYLLKIAMISEWHILFGISRPFMRLKLPYCYLPKVQVFNLTVLPTLFPVQPHQCYHLPTVQSCYKGIVCVKLYYLCTTQTLSNKFKQVLPASSHSEALQSLVRTWPAGTFWPQTVLPP